ncbi:MAG: response regulator [Lysobacterales bacterium]
MRILIADDNEINREFLKAALSDPASTICEAVNGRDALNQFRSQPFDLILMDIRMPEMDGIEATVAIRQTESSAAPKARIIGLTADLQLTTTTDLRQQGFDDCLAKPISREAVRQLLANDPQPQKIAEQPEFPVLDRAAALAAAGGNEELLDRLMSMLKKELISFLPQIGNAIEHGDFATAKEPVHKLRGSAGYTGCMELKQAAAKLELALTRAIDIEINNAFKDLRQAADNLSRL